MLAEQEAPVLAHPSVAEREEHGRAERQTVPRTAHAAWEPPADRRDPVEMLEEQAATRVPELVPLRYGRMLVSPFTFYRGGAYLMAADLAGLPRTSLHTQLCGDAHLSNFGAYAAPDRELVFDLNDFDETLPGPFEWDLKRLVTSFAVAGRDRGFGANRRAEITMSAARGYREAMAGFAGSRNLDLWYARDRVDDVLADFRSQAKGSEVKRAEKNLAKATGKSSLKAFAKLTELVDGERRIRSDPPALVPVHELFPPEMHERLDAAAAAMIRAYRGTLSGDRRHLVERFRYVDAARKVVGVGSVGTRAWIVLLLGRDDDDPLFLQVKEAQASVLEPFLGSSEFQSHGQRVVEGQRITQSANDILLGWMSTEALDGVSRHYYVRQLWDKKGSALVDLMSPRTMNGYAELCGRTLARAHARAGDGVAIAAYMGRSESFDRALARFAESYADQNERDFAAVRAAVDAGTIAAESGI